MRLLRFRDTRFPMMLAPRLLSVVLVTVLELLPAAMAGPGPAPTVAKEEVARPFDFARELQLLHAGRLEEQGGRDDFGGRQRVLMERAVQVDALAAAQTILDRPELVMVGDFWLINAQALFRLWGKADLPAMAEWVETHPLNPKLQPAADYALFQHRVAGLAEGEAIALWRKLPEATRHWAKRDIASIIAGREPATALERLARLFPAEERGEMMSLALDVVARKHPRTLLPWLEELAPFFYNEPAGSEALLRLTAAEVETALLALNDRARAEILLEYMRRCVSQDAPERVRRLVSGVTVEPYKSLIEKEWSASEEATQAPQQCEGERG
jgi:hypothetical protein